MCVLESWAFYWPGAMEDIMEYLMNERVNINILKMYVRAQPLLVYTQEQDI